MIPQLIEKAVDRRAHGRFTVDGLERSKNDAFNDALTRGILVTMTILPRLVSIALKKFNEQPNDREPAVRMLLHNAIRLAVSHLGRQEAVSIMREALREPAL